MTHHWNAFLAETVAELIERGSDAKRRREGLAKSSPDYMFQAGRLMGFNEALSILQQQARGMGIDLASIGLDEVVPDRDFT